jgi:hypothetical protein
MLLGFDATTIRGNKTGVGYYSARLLERLTSVGGDENPIDEILVFPAACSSTKAASGFARYGCRRCSPWSSGAYVPTSATSRIS